jgi:CelD/BcsL family acetyltransferase involved in cellulose biosynthesis
VSVTPDVVARVLVMSTDADFLSTLGKRQRHEVKRKWRRYEALVGEIGIETDRDGAFQRFAELHRASPGRKGEFMVGERERFFEALYEQPGWRIDELFDGERTVASLFGFSGGTTYYLYNSAFAADLFEASPGIVLLTRVIGQLASDGCTRFDFLKGDEPYKARLGASSRQLYRIEA